MLFFASSLNVASEDERRERGFYESPLATLETPIGVDTVGQSAFRLSRLHGPGPLFLLASVTVLPVANRPYRPFSFKSAGK